ncbi:Asp-tRNA(Asn)/Glu-tRNA(Gln) amidotransferase subunit GatC [bacterium]|nr:Asp-tRNA(Asn)/Glu-tRNA(Gln) amidotransferase subunit GatC [bacterium]
MKKKSLTINHLAKLAHLKIKEEKEKLAKQLKETIEYINILKEIDTTKIPPAFGSLDLKNVSREDKVQESLSPSKVLENAPKKRDGYFVVPRIRWEE